MHVNGNVIVPIVILGVVCLCVSVGWLHVCLSVWMFGINPTSFFHDCKWVCILFSLFVHITIVYEHKQVVYTDK